MKKILGIAIAAAIAFASCKKDSNNCAYSNNIRAASVAQKDSLRSYLVRNNIQATESPNGFFYQVVDPGSGATPGVCSVVATKYTASILQTGRVFDETGNYPRSFVVGQLVDGAKAGLQLIKKGGNIILYLPPDLAYGPNDVTDRYGQVVIPAGSYLKFDFTLTDVQ